MQGQVAHPAGTKASRLDHRDSNNNHCPGSERLIHGVLAKPLHTRVAWRTGRGHEGAAISHGGALSYEVRPSGLHRNALELDPIRLRYAYGAKLTTVERKSKAPGNINVSRGLGWLRGQDSNLRPSGYEPDELPDCSTPRGFRARGALGRPGGDLLSHALRRSTIGAEGFHGRVRDGIGCLVPRHDHQVVERCRSGGPGCRPIVPATRALDAARGKSSRTSD